MNVLSLFDGMSCGQIALNKLGIKYDNYFASEIDKYAIQVTQKNYPNTKQIGSITDVKGEYLPKIDLLFGGSPCQSFSNAGNNKGFDGQSGLFWEFVRLLKETKPKYFMLENVKMKKEWEKVITDALGVEPILINSSLVSAAHRKRLYWTNIPNIEQPKDKGIFIEDIVCSEESIDFNLWLKAKNTWQLLNKINFKDCPKISAIDVYNKKYKTDRKVPTLTLPHHNSLRLWQNGRVRKFNANELEEFQNVPKNYTNVDLTLNQRHELLGNGWTVDVIAHIFKNIPLT
ncbi:DNA methyltransferase [Synechococcus phage S-CBS2]|uniref:DNA methyltransferase n=1 Tax=Synechococcus phage S-CBS2 TaxID=753084 RepID=UPI00020783DE|nr:DNA methyltransferase [Synechococcus phage S-CBS2]ADF42361.1 DNA methylase [Synechococcus phage S-CBS2]